MPTITKLYSMEEAAQHNTNDDCWVVIDGKVYDVSSYLDEHPGGDDVLLSSAGTDATEGFEDAGHSKTARDLLEQFFIGELDEPPPPIPKLEIVYKKQEDNGIVGKVLNLGKENWAVPVAAVGLSVAVGFLYLRKK
ncbi:Cytochrome b5 isoform A [Castilleja foliolosa]|uniref:Cytochrome b5 isoform A n=1 Tax=Castilleja foliolosa TaxID=1961234 RepID=A0ABD3D2I2_9LAMI